MRKICVLATALVLSVAGGAIAAPSNLKGGYPRFDFQRPVAPRPGADTNRDTYSRYVNSMGFYKKAFDRYMANTKDDERTIKREKDKAQRDFDKDWNEYQRIRKSYYK